MTTIANTARVTVTEDTYEETKAKAWQVWDAALKEARSKGSAQLTNGATHVPGYRLRGSMSEVIRRVFPLSRSYGPDDWEKFRRSITSHLVASGNAACLVRKPATWWVAAVWQDNAAGHDEIVTRLDLIEQRLTPHEAGEDREVPDLVVIHRNQPIATDETEELVLDLLNRNDEPLASAEVAFVIGDLKPPHVPTIPGNPKPKQLIAGGTTTRALDRLVERNLAFRRLETYDERRVRAGMPAGMPGGRLGFLYSTKNPVPPRVSREVVKGYVLETVELPQGAGAEMGRRKAARRNEAVLTAILSASGPINNAGIRAATKLSRGQVEDSLKTLLDEGLIHHGPATRNGRYFLPIDAPLDALTAPKAKSKSRSRSALRNMSSTELGVVRAARELVASNTEPFTLGDLARISGYHRSTCGDVVRKFSNLFTFVGNQNHFRQFTFNDPDVHNDKEPTTMPAPAATTTTPAPAPARTSTGGDCGALQRAVLQTLALSDGDYNSLRDSLIAILGVDNVDTLALQAEVADLRARLDRARQQITALTNI